ncbi:EF-hand domain-containing protein [Sphingomonas sp. G124]|uniref:EF-hand domain-containing protein n=1 Tax=Sphingomonas cremea TaxID=2904799 RepID=A0A9X1TW39_9SPHN|nr:EF-hand domain-containing protein [Sphingomonas cremea]MCF2514869.1 EF-hand domain-containing protein [Sphingomonas cremea]
MNRQLLMIAILASATGPAFAQAAAKPAAPQPITKAAYIQRVDRSFSANDTNKDGFIDKSEIEVAETKAIGTRKAQMINQREAAFRQMDTNKDGSLSLKEYNAQLVAQPLPKPNAAPMLARLDTNKDGKISAAESRAPAVAQFDRADTNKDGTLSVEEQQKARAKK